MTTNNEQNMSPPEPPVVREGEYEGSTYRIETYHAPEEL